MTSGPSSSSPGGCARRLPACSAPVCRVRSSFSTTTCSRARWSAGSCARRRRAPIASSPCPTRSRAISTRPGRSARAWSSSVPGSTSRGSRARRVPRIRRRCWCWARSPAGSDRTWPSMPARSPTATIPSCGCGSWGHRSTMTGCRRPSSSARTRLGFVSLPGAVADPAPELARAFCLLHCAEREPFGMAVLEALAAGRPVVAPAAAGPAEIVDRSCGLLYEPGDARAAAAALTDLLGDPERASALGAAGRARAGREFGLDAARSRYAAASRR